MVGELGDIGARLRRLGVSASLISQVESGQSKPSVSTLYAIVTELGVSLDDVFKVHGREHVAVAAAGAGTIEPEIESGPVVRPSERHVIELESGVTWERLTSHQHENVDFLHVIYDVEGSSSPDERLMRHSGREYGFVISGTLGVQLGFERHELGPGDSIAYDSTMPHRLWNLGDEPVHGIWFVVGRGG